MEIESGVWHIDINIFAPSVAAVRGCPICSTEAAWAPPNMLSPFQTTLVVDDINQKFSCLAVAGA
jgi:hypothetical protein